MNKLLYLSFLLLAGCSTIQHKLENTKFETIQQAAIYALDQSSRSSFQFEYGGMIYQNKTDHTFVVTVPVTRGNSTSVRLSHSFKFPGYREVADYHTHPCMDGYFSNYFSPGDIYGNRSLKIIGYVADLCTGNVQEYNPQRDSLDMIINENMKVTAGKNVGQISTQR